MIIRQGIARVFRVFRAAGMRQERTFPFGILSQLVAGDEKGHLSRLVV